MNLIAIKQHLIYLKNEKFKDMRLFSSPYIQISEFKYLVSDFSDMFKADNSNFNRDKFAEAVYK